MFRGYYGDDDLVLFWRYLLGYDDWNCIREIVSFKKASRNFYV